MQTTEDRYWHPLSTEAVLVMLDADPVLGLDPAEARQRQMRHGPNRLQPRTGPSPLWRFLRQFHSPLLYILLLAAGVAFFVKGLVDALTILIVVLINAVIGYIQEARAEGAIAALAKTLTTEAQVWRGGRLLLLAAEELVPGDLVQLQAGDKVPADLRLLRTRDLQIAEAVLTGESRAVEKDALAELPGETLLAERSNMAYASTLVVHGQGVGVVVATGMATEIGCISRLLAALPELETPLTRKLAQLSRILLFIILLLAGAVFAIGLLRSLPPAEIFLAAVALAVGGIPEGLPAAMTVTLAIGVARMARRRAIIRKLPAVEALGSATVICTDKTGTLTRNQMTVQALYAGGQAYTVSGVGYAPQGALTPPPGNNQALQQCLLAGVLCNDSVLHDEAGNWLVQGDPTEAALRVVAGKAALVPAADEYPRLDVLPFDSLHQYMATLHGGAAGQRWIYLKGALEPVLGACATMLDATGKLQPCQAGEIHRQAAMLASQGLRVLALARKPLPVGQAQLSHADLAGGLEWLGLQAMLDPPRPEALIAVQACQAAGVQVKMITGDHALTARAVAEQVGLRGATDAQGLRVLTGSDLARLHEEALQLAAEEVAVFARVTPEQKLRLVEALQGRGHIVAMTGDGVNDAPALKQADIGVAMAQSGTEVAREAADMVLTDDNFASLQAAVEEGRVVLDNLSKFLVWALPANLGIGLVVLVAGLAGVPLPVLPAQILWINMTTAGALGLVLALEPRESDVMCRPSRDPLLPLLTGALLGRVLLAGSLIVAAAFVAFEWALSRGASLAEARTEAVNVIVLIQLAYLFNCRSLSRSLFEQGLFSNHWLGVGIGIMLLLQLGFTYLPPLQALFGSAPVTLAAWLRALLAGGLVLGLVELEKAARRRALA